MEDFHKEFQEKNSDVKSRFDIGNASGKKWISMINEADILIMATDIFTDTKVSIPFTSYFLPFSI
uniref:Uncharacterized protein n=1 Tax=Glycine max TaxID=3847 RepID=A0A0R0KR97_SOYBN